MAVPSHSRISPSSKDNDVKEADVKKIIMFEPGNQAITKLGGSGARLDAVYIVGRGKAHQY